MASIVLSLSLAACAQPSAVDRAAHFVRTHQEAEAKKVLRDRLAEHPDDIGARRMLVRVLAWTGDLEGARKEVEELQRKMPDDPIPWIELGHAFELTHRFDEALAAYDTAASVAPTNPAGPREGGMRCARWGEPEEAAQRLEEAVRRGAHDAEIMHVLGLVRVNLRDYPAARDAYEKGLVADPDSVENLLGLATVAIASDDPPAALAAYDRLLAKKPGYASAELGRAWALAKMGRRDDAKLAIDRAEKLGAPHENVAKLRSLLQ